jgi:DNA repair protein RecN (Recombination protein N)
MLRTLYVKDFAIIDRAEIALSSGMTVLTGETGAGKSLLVDALLLLTGARGDAGVVRHGADRAELSAEFDLRALPAAREWLRERELDEEESLRLRRVIRADGSSRAYLNDSPVSLTLLREAAEHLVEIHGQHEHQALLTRKHQRALLDAFGGHRAALAEVARWARRHAEIEREIAALADGEQHDPERVAFLQFQQSELQKHALSPEEYARQLDDHRRLAHAATLIEGAERIVQQLDGDQEDALQSRLVKLSGECRRLAGLDPALGSIAELLDAATIQLGEASSELERYLSSNDLDPDRYTELDRQLARLHDLGRKYRVAPAELAAKATQLAADLERIEQAGGRRDILLEQRNEVLKQYQLAARQLATQRQLSAKKLSAEVTALLHELAIAGQFEVQLEANTDLVRSEGYEEVEFLVSPNPGQPLRPLRKIASGGELARVALAIEVAAIGSDDIPVMVFDEVDSGIGGATAEVVGRKLRQLGQARQVLCVTHLPQVAAQGHQHFAVRKFSTEGDTQTAFNEVQGKARTEEVARMLGGVELTRETRANAEQMLKKAASA